MDAFTSLEELYNRLLPALKNKRREMKREKMIQINELDIWQYFCQNIWPNKTNLTLGEMVDDILNTDNFTIYKETRRDGFHGTN